MPVAFGETVAMRILDREALFPDLKPMLRNKDGFSAWQEFAQHPHGIMPVAGPTGSVKSAALYSAPLQIATSEINATAVEDRIEMVHEQMDQIGVKPKGGIVASRSGASSA